MSYLIPTVSMKVVENGAVISKKSQGRDLTELRLKNDLNKIFKQFADRSEELAPSGSTQANEAINSIVGSKAPKIRHYGDFESSDFRCAAAVCQKNEGH